MTDRRLTCKCIPNATSTFRFFHDTFVDHKFCTAFFTFGCSLLQQAGNEFYFLDLIFHWIQNFCCPHQHRHMGIRIRRAHDATGIPLNTSLLTDFHGISALQLPAMHPISARNKMVGPGNPPWSNQPPLVWAIPVLVYSKDWKYFAMYSDVLNSRLLIQHFDEANAELRWFGFDFSSQFYPP